MSTKEDLHYLPSRSTLGPDFYARQECTLGECDVYPGLQSPTLRWRGSDSEGHPAHPDPRPRVGEVTRKLVFQWGQKTGTRNVQTFLFTVVEISFHLS